MRRIDWHLSVDVLEPEHRKLICDHAQIRNVCKNGLGVLSSESLARNAVYVFEFRLFDRRWSVPGRVLHTRNRNTYFFSGVNLDFRTLADRHDWIVCLSHHSRDIQISSVAYAVIVGTIVAGFSLYQWHVPISIAWVIFFSGILFFSLLLPF
ncbi:MAG: hypothetical protein WC859_04735 [Elusimicrobiota bacterium]|jgi:hypothetical protein